MSVNKSVLLLLLCYLQSSLSQENNSEIGFMSSVRHCAKKQPKVLAYCLLKHSILSMDRAIESNSTWHINDFLSMKKNAEWKPVEPVQEVRENGGDHNIYGVFMQKASDLVRSRTFEFSIPSVETGMRSGRLFGETGRKKKNKGGIMMSGIAVVAMLAQMFLGKIAFLAAAALLLSKIALMFSAVNALKKQSSSSSGGEHVVYAEQPHASSSGWQRSFPKPKQYGSHEFDMKGSYVEDTTLTSGSF